MEEIYEKDLENIDGYEEAVKVFGLCNDDDASECFRKMSVLKKKANELQDQFKREFDRIDAWYQKELSPIKNRIETFEAEIIAYYKYKRMNDPKARVSTPYGKVATRKSTKWVYSDEDSAINYLQGKCPELIKTSYALDKQALKKAYPHGVNLETGECLPGIDLVEEESISLKEI